MPYPNYTASVIVISQTSGSSVSGQFPFIERQISGSNLFLITDASGFLTGSTTIPGGTFTSLTVTGALTASIISASTAITSAAATFTGPVTMSSMLSASGGLTSSNIYDTGTLTVIGNTNLANTFVTNLTASNISASSISGSLSGSFSGSHFGTSSWAQSASNAINSQTASFLSTGTYSITSSWATNSLTASSLITTNNYVINNLTASNISASGTITASSLNITTGIIDGGTFTVLGNSILGDQITDSITMTGSVNITGSMSLNGNFTASNISSSGNITSSGIFLTGLSYATGISSSGTIAATTIIAASRLIAGNTSSNLSNTAVFYGPVEFSASLQPAIVNISGSIFAKISAGTGSTTAITYFSSSASTGSNITSQIDSSTLIGSAVALLLNATGSTTSYAISASSGTIIGTVFSGSIFSGSFSGSHFGTSSVAQSASVATTTLSSSITNLPTTAGTFYMTFVGNTGSSQPLYTDDSALTWNPNTNQLTTNGQIVVGSISSSGAIIGASITGAMSGSSISTGNATINGGTINGTTIGVTTPSTGNFTNLTASNISASGVITSSGLFDTGNLTVLGNTTLGDQITDITIITGSLNQSGSHSIIGSLTASGNISSSGNISASTGWFNNLTVAGTLNATVSGSITNASSASITANNSTATLQYITFVDGTGNRPLYVDQDSLTWIPSTNTLSSSGNIITNNLTASTGINTSIINTSGTSYLFPSSSQTLIGQVGGLTQFLGDIQLGSNGLIKGSNGGSGMNVYSTGIVIYGNSISGSDGNGYISFNTSTPGTNIASTAAASIAGTAALTVQGGAYIGKNLIVSGSTTLYGDLTLMGTGSIVNISSSTLIIGDNRIQLNTWNSSGTPQRYAGIDVVDSGSTTNVTSSILFDSLKNYWLLQTNISSSTPLVTSSALILQGPTSSFGSEYLLTVNNFLKVQTQTGNMITSSLSEVGNILQYTGTISASIFSGSSIFIGSTITSATGSFTNLTIVTGSAPGVGAQVPSTPTAIGLPGQIEVDNNFIYVYTNNAWKRAPLSVWAL